MNNWISIKNDLPDLYKFVLVLANYKETGEPNPIAIARINENNQWEFLNNDFSSSSYGAWMDIEYSIDSELITHWMPLPKIPKEYLN